MIRILDGPAAGAELPLRRAPIFLRVVVNRKNNRIDGLDQLDDTPRPNEDVFVYRAIEGTLFNLPDGTFICGRGGAMAAAAGDYVHVEMDGNTLRDTGAWRAWCLSQPVSKRTYNPVTREYIEASL